MKTKTIAALVSAACLFIGVSATPALAQGPVLDKKFSNCSALNKVYPGGVAKSSKSVNKGGEIKKKPTVNAKVYSENSGKDRDKDGLACEN
jgi:hypothetical protein